MSIQIFRLDKGTRENLLLKAGEALNDSFKRFSNKPILFLSSGGSCLPLLELIDISILNSNITISPLDERYSLNPNINNMAQIAGTKFFLAARSAGCQFIDTRVLREETQKDLAVRFETDLINWLKRNPDGKIIATVGIGVDGHLSGIMPYPENPEKFKEMFESDRFVISCDAGDKNQYRFRVTTTLTFLRKIDVAICYAVGESKKVVIKSLLSDEGNSATIPASILREIKGKILLFTDQSN